MKEPVFGPLGTNLATILVVDDNQLVLNVVVAILERANFHVLRALSPVAALKLGAETTEPIDLLLSDIDLPGMSGPQLGESLKHTRPNMRVMLMSGGGNGLLVMNYGWSYLQKPFLAESLVRMVTEVLHSEDRSQVFDRFDTRLDQGNKN